MVLGYDPGNRETSISRTVGGTGTVGQHILRSVNDSANHGSARSPTQSGGTTTALATYVYGYDNANRVTTEVNAEGTVTYTYDSGGELLTARGSRTENYSYDSGGNRNMSGYTTGTGNELTSRRRLHVHLRQRRQHDRPDTALDGHVWTFGYDDRNRLISAVEKNSGGTTLDRRRTPTTP